MTHATQTNPWHLYSTWHQLNTYAYQAQPSQNADRTQSGSTDERNTRIFQGNSTLPLKAALFVATTDHRYLDPAHIEQHTYHRCCSHHREYHVPQLPMQYRCSIAPTSTPSSEGNCCNGGRNRGRRFLAGIDGWYWREQWWPPSCRSLEWRKQRRCGLNNNRMINNHFQRRLDHQSSFYLYLFCSLCNIMSRCMLLWVNFHHL